MLTARMDGNAVAEAGTLAEGGDDLMLKVWMDGELVDQATGLRPQPYWEGMVAPYLDIGSGA